MSKSPLEQSNRYSTTSIVPPTNPAGYTYQLKCSKPKRKDIALLADSIPNGMRMKDLNSRVKGEKIHLKLFCGAKASQLNRYIISTLEEYNMIVRLLISSVSMAFSGIKMILI